MPALIFPKPTAAVPGAPPPSPQRPDLIVEIGRVHGWQLGVSGSSELGTTTSLADFEWVDISDKVLSASIRRGRQHELDRVEAGTASVSLLNQDGVFNPTNTQSPYYPTIWPMTPFRIRAEFPPGVEVPPVAPPWSPADITGLVAWYDYSDVSSLWQDTARTSAVTTDGQTIKGVTDKTTLGRDASEATNGPTYKTGIQNGLSIARFDGSNDQLLVTDHASIEMDTDSTVFIVAKLTTGSTTRALISKSQTGSTAGAYYLATSASDKPKIDRPFVEAGLDATNSVGTTNFRIIAEKVSGTAVSHYLDGSTNGTDTLAVGTATNTDLRIGTFKADNLQPWNGDMGEIAIYNAALSTADINSVGQYLGTKWAITWTGI